MESYEDMYDNLANCCAINSLLMGKGLQLCDCNWVSQYLPYSRKYWQELNLANWTILLLADFDLRRTMVSPYIQCHAYAHKKI